MNTVQIDNTKNLTFHKLCDMFPEMTESEYTALVRDIKTNQLLESIVLFEDRPEDYSILDGRNRWLACSDAGVTPHFVLYDGEDPLQYVVSKNVGRRHLSSGQLAALASRIANLSIGDNQFSMGETDEEGISLPKAAEIFGTSAKAIQRYRFIEKNDPDIAEQVALGIETLNGGHAKARIQAKGQNEDIDPEDGPNVGLKDSEGGVKSTKTLKEFEEMFEENRLNAAPDFQTDPYEPEPVTDPPTKADVDANVAQMEEVHPVSVIINAFELEDLMNGNEIIRTSGSLTFVMRLGEHD